MTAWSAGAIYYSDLPGPRVRAVLAIAAVVATGLAFARLPRRGLTLAGFVFAFTVLLGWWLRTPASNNRDWQPEVALSPWATVEGDRVTIYGVRNFDYRTETSFVPRWEDRTYDLRRLDSADLIAVYWAGKPIAHIIVSFGFEGQDYVAISIETRKERGESYSTVAGFFRHTSWSMWSRTSATSSGCGPPTGSRRRPCISTACASRGRTSAARSSTTFGR
jgi:hypothetical protein